MLLLFFSVHLASSGSDQCPKECITFPSDCSEWRKKEYEPFLKAQSADEVLNFIAVDISLIQGFKGGWVGEEGCVNLNQLISF